MFMMKDAHPQLFFTLDDFTHKELFTNSQYVWDALKQLTSYLDTKSLGEKNSMVPEGVCLVKSHLITIGKDCVIEPGAYIEGPCIIGDGTIIRHGSYIRGYVVTGNSCVIGHATEVKHSIFLNRAKAAHFNYVGDSILGNDTNLGAGVICANLRIDKKNIHVMVDGKRLDTQMQKLGLILADGAQMGCNSVSNPGTLMGRGSMCFPCVNVSGAVPDKSIVKGSKFSIEASE